MVSLFFAISPEDLRYYEDWYENDYEDDYYDDYEEEYYNEYDYNDNYIKEKSNFIKLIFFDEMLKSFVNKLSERNAKEILIEELKKDEKCTFNTYLKNEYKKYIIP